ncbi:MAG: hypothetical protein OXF08_11425, partial [Bacteroidetes bacterium]|nr:hypothetical protein [Bacteroidota bacterium]
IFGVEKQIYYNELFFREPLGRRVSVYSPTYHAAGWGREIELNGKGLSSGTYYYRLVSESPNGQSILSGRFVKIQ